MVAKKKAVAKSTKLYRADKGVVPFPASQVKRVMENGGWVKPTAKQLKGK